MKCNIDWWNIELGMEEKEAVVNAISHRNIAQGVLTEEFEKKLADFLNVPYCVMTPNGTQALTLSYMALGIKHGDEVIVSNRTFVATAHAASILGAKIIAVDVKDNQTIDETQIERMITPKTRAIVPVHMNGVASNMQEIIALSRKYNIDVVEDACQAFGSKDRFGRKLGTYGRFACFSLGLAKILTTGQGGFVVANSKEDYDLLRRIRNQGVFNVREEHSYEIGAYNFKFTDILASIGIEQLKKIEKKIERSREIYKRYYYSLEGCVDLLHSAVADGEVPMRVIALTEKKQELRDYLKSIGIFTSFESPSLNLCPHLNISGNYPKSLFFDERMLILPSGPDQSLDNVDIVCDEIKRWCKKN